jgi:type VI secretion system secreted protein VgrG
MAQKDPYSIEMYGGYDEKGVKLVAGIIEGEVNGLPKAKIEFVSSDRLLDLKGFVGNEMGFSIVGSDEKTQRFYGTCISAEYKGSPTGDAHYFAEIRPWFWFLTRSENNRIFQNKKTTDIVQEILSDYNFSGDLELKHTGEEIDREYCVQYRESDFSFLKRLCEEDGIYFYFDFLEDGVKLVLADSASTHQSIEGDDKIPFRDDEAEQQLDHIYKWENAEKVSTGKITLEDYNFEKPKAVLTASASIEKGKHAHKGYEVYKYPGRYRDVKDGEKFADSLMEAEASAHKKWVGEGNAHNMWVGQVFELIDHPRHTSADLSTFMVTKAKQYFRLVAGDEEIAASVMEGIEDFGLSAFEHTRIAFETVLKSDIFRMPMLTPKPEIAGIHTAVVTGASGDEIGVDQYGRIKVQFHWDRDGENDDKTTCWVRTMMPWTGKGWGMIALPRIGQEVVIQFEEGDPDRPMCVGMLYNADTMPPYELPANATRTGIKTNSSKGGNGYNELMFEDKKGEELVRLEAEKNFTHLVQNSSHTRIGYKHEKDTKTTAVKNPATGDDKMSESMMLEIKKDLVQIMEEGNHYLEVKDGQQDIKVKKDKTEDIDGKFIQTVIKDVIRTISEGNLEETVKQGNVTRETSVGSETNTVKLGDYTLKTSAGGIELEAMTKIKLKCGGSSIEMTPMDITIKSPTININADMNLTAKGGIGATVEGGAMVTVKGGMVMIN